LWLEFGNSVSPNRQGREGGWQYLVGDWELFAGEVLEGEGEQAHGGGHWEERLRLEAVRVTSQCIYTYPPRGNWAFNGPSSSSRLRRACCSLYSCPSPALCFSVSCLRWRRLGGHRCRRPTPGAQVFHRWDLRRRRASHQVRAPPSLRLLLCETEHPNPSYVYSDLI